ncbi:ATP-dependent RNA helicase RhlB [Agaribacterium haliotis]|uniref:ATP-dependent RNA helicase RhlB n=1 Tax=Agaribacterium haliotis TaxID=2013869 RepID=UPI00195A88FA|nr:ATP-dependent RNA helicase RhlB [Agaribacterium haliotis]
MLFTELSLSAPIQKALADMNFTTCSPIQEKSLPWSLAGHDVMGKAQTGTGKTAAFLLALFESLINESAPDERYAGEPRAVVLSPTRELALQIEKDAIELNKYLNLHIVSLVGGVDYDKQMKKLQAKHVDIVIATPGRLIDFCEKRYVYLDQCEVLVIDEADRMLDMGFIPQVKRIERYCPRKDCRQTMMFSATFNNDVERLGERWMVDPARVEIEPKSVATDTVEQKLYMVGSDEKLDILKNIISEDDVNSAMIFANRRDECRRLHDELRHAGYKVGLLSGDIAQNKRIKTLEAFKKGQLKFLVATDVAGRGIHIDGVSHVINYTLPEEPEDYVHRIGRTGRAGTSGTSISFACEDDAFRLPSIEKLLGGKLECEHPPESLLKGL